MSRQHALDLLRRRVGSQRAIADALGVDPRTVSRWATNAIEIPEYVVAIAELLAALPLKDWPERWHR